MTGNIIEKVRQTRSDDPDVASLLTEVDRVSTLFRDHSLSIAQKLDCIEQDMLLLEQENARLVEVKVGLTVEMDICVALIVKLAAGMRVTCDQSQRLVAIDFPAGKAVWEYAASEAYLFEQLSHESLQYQEPQERYRSVLHMLA